MKPGRIVFNGVDGATGRYLRPPVDLDELAQRLGRRRRPIPPPPPVQGPVAGVDPCDLGQAGWGVVFAPGTPAAVREALAPLLRHREAQAGGLYKQCEVRPGESAGAFLRRHGRGPGPVDPKKLPYYLLIVGSPEEVPFLFQHQLDVQHGVGRIDFDDPEEAASYARGVVAAETSGAARPRQAAFFAPCHPGDDLTRRSVEDLVLPLADRLGQQAARWEVIQQVEKKATRPALESLLGGEQTPSLLFTASHGLGFWATDPRQREMQGALICSEWPGPTAETISPEHYFTAGDLSDGVCPAGLVSFHFACYSAGTPRWDTFAPLGSDEPKVVAPQAFLARLPQRLLARGALAVIGHVDVVWPCSFLWEEAGAQLEVFESTLRLLLEGWPVGAAMEFFGQRYAEIAAELASRLEPVPGDPNPVGDLDLATLWLAAGDARSYLLCGDPAVRVPAAARR